MLVGGAFYLGLFAWCLFRYSGAEYMGMKDEGTTDSVSAMFQSEILRLQFRLALTYLGIGLVVGFVAGLHWLVVCTIRRKRAIRVRPLLLRLVLTVWALHLWFLFRGMVTHPQVYVDHFYAAGGLWGWLQVTLTDLASPAAFDAILFAYLTVLLGAAIIVWQARLVRLLRQPARAIPLAVVLAALLFGGAALTRPDPPPPPRDHNLLIISVDSLRPDRLNAAEGGPELANLQALAAESVQFTNAWTVMPRTFPSWVSTLTGQYPHEHGIRHMFPGPTDLARSRETLMTRLRDAGYQTVVISDFAGDIFSRIELGFDQVRVPRFTMWSNTELGSYKLHYHLFPYLTSVLGGSKRYPILKLYERLADPDALTEEALGWLRTRSDKPFALVVFYSAPHFPYATPWPWYKRHTASDYDGPSRYHKATWVDTATSPGHAEEEQINALYSSALEATDAAIGRLLTELDTMDLLDRTHVVLTADHGENLYEKGLGIGHGDHLRGTGSLRVPLLLRPAGERRKRRVVHNPVRSIDLAPTLLDYLKLPALAQASGRSLKPLADGREVGSDPPIFFETGLWFLNPGAAVLEGRTIAFADVKGAYLVDPDTHEIYFNESFDDDFLVAKHRAVLHDGYKLLYIPTRQGVLWELYDVRNDPEETRNVIAEQPEVAGSLRAMLKDWMLSDPDMMEQGDFVVPCLRL